MRSKILLSFGLCFLNFFCIAQSADKFTVMTYNVHHGANKDEINTLDSMGLFIKSSGAALIGLQEVDSICNRSGKTDQMKRLGELSGMHYAFARHFAYDGGAYGQGILSRYPIEAVENIRLPILKKDSLRQSLALITALVNIPGKGRVLLANAHFSLDQPTRLLQATAVLDHLKKKNLPAIFMGDLNSTPEQEEIELLKKELIPASSFHQPSYPTNPPTKTIDYIFLNQQLNAKPVKQWVPAIHCSDHLPVLSTLQF